MREIDKESLIDILRTGLRENDTFTVAIDGGSASGKTTLAEELRAGFSGEETMRPSGATPIPVSVFHMDDFYLRPEQRTPERYEEPGGNVDRERFRDEVLTALMAGEKVLYRPLDCRDFTISEGTYVTPGRLRIVEGAYSHHPELRDAYDLRVFLDIEPELQAERVRKRNTPEEQERFFGKWIPLENKYFQAFAIKEKSDVVIRIR